MNIIDFHTHPYVTFAENTCMYKSFLNLSMEEAIEDIKHSGITHICGSVISPASYKPEDGFSHLLECNQHALDLRNRYPDFYTPGFHIHPGFIKESIAEIERMHKEGVRLIGELVPYMHGWANMGLHYGSPSLQEILRHASKYNMVVSFHTMSEWARETEEMVANNPDITFVAAHPGQKADFLLHIDRMKKYPNLYLDLSGTGLFRYGMLAYGIHELGADRFLFGTDYPITNPQMYVQAVLGEHICKEDRECVFHKNAERILF